jgi:hypothetical protein
MEYLLAREENLNDRATSDRYILGKRLLKSTPTSSHDSPRHLYNKIHIDSSTEYRTCFGTTFGMINDCDQKRVMDCMKRGDGVESTISTIYRTSFQEYRFAPMYLTWASRPSLSRQAKDNISALAYFSRSLCWLARRNKSL